MSTTHLIEALPDLVVLLRRDGIVLSCYGGRSVARLRPSADPAGKHLEDIWAEPMSGLIRQLIREAVARRSIARAMFREAGHRYGLRVSVQGSDRAVCVIRAVSDGVRSSTSATLACPQPHLTRRALLRRYTDTMSNAATRTMPAAVAVIHIDGVTDLAQIISTSMSERILKEALRRLQPLCDDTAHHGVSYLGQLTDNFLLVVLGTADREALAASLAQVCDCLRQPVSTGDALFHLTPYAGVAILGQDTASPKTLLDHASAAAAQARRSGAVHACFYSDAARLQAVARLDIARELRTAIAQGAIGLRYTGRHDLASGRLVSWVGHLRWQHRLYGEIHPLELVRLAEITGLARDLSRAAFQCLQNDYGSLIGRGDAGVRISIGPPRHHVLHESFVGDIEHFLAEAVVPPERLELRISVKAALSRSPTDLHSLARRGVQLIVDDMGRGMDLPLAWLARAPVRGLQLNRAWVRAVHSDAVALKMCRAGVGVATALGLVPIATSVDELAQRDVLLDAGCTQGAGELYRDLLPVPRLDIMEATRALVAA